MSPGEQLDCYYIIVRRDKFFQKNFKHFTQAYHSLLNYAYRIDAEVDRVMGSPYSVNNDIEDEICLKKTAFTIENNNFKIKNFFKIKASNELFETIIFKNTDEKLVKKLKSSKHISVIHLEFDEGLEIKEVIKYGKAVEKINNAPYKIENLIKIARFIAKNPPEIESRKEKVFDKKGLYYPLSGEAKKFSSIFDEGDIASINFLIEYIASSLVFKFFPSFRFPPELIGEMQKYENIAEEKGKLNDYIDHLVANPELMKDFVPEDFEKIGEQTLFERDLMNEFKARLNKKKMGEIFENCEIPIKRKNSI